MKLVIHLLNILIWWIVPLIFLIVLSFLIGFSYYEAVKSFAFGLFYIIFCLVITGTYISDTFNDEETFHFIKNR